MLHRQQPLAGTRLTWCKEMDCHTRTGQLLPRHRCNRANVTRPSAAAGAGDTVEEVGEWEVEATEALTVMAIGFLDVM